VYLVSPCVLTFQSIPSSPLDLQDPLDIGSPWHGCDRYKADRVALDEEEDKVRYKFIES